MTSQQATVLLSELRYIQFGVAFIIALTGLIIILLAFKR